MKINLNKIDNLNAELSIELVAEDYNPVIEKKLKELKKTVNIPGFRKGMVPMSHVQRLFGKETKYRAIQELIYESLSNYLKEQNPKILGEPIMNNQKSENIEVTETKNSIQVVFDLGLKPEIEITFSKKDKVDFEKIEIKEEDIDREIERYQNNFGTYTDVEKTEDKELIIGNLRQLDTEGKVLEDGIKVDAGFLSLEQIKKQKDIFIGKKVGDTLTFNPKKILETTEEIARLLNIQKEDAENLDCNFSFEITQVRRFTLAELNKDLFSKAFPNVEIETTEEFRQQIKSEIEKLYLKAETNKLYQKIKEYLLEKINPELPESFLKRYLSETNQKYTPERVENEWHELRKMYQWQLIVDKIAEEAQIKIEQEDLLTIAAEDVEASFRMYGLSNIPSETLMRLAKSKLEKEDDVNYYYWRTLEQKVLENVKEKIQLKEKTVTVDKF